MKIKPDYNREETITGLLFNAPLVITAIVFILIPVAGTIVTSLNRDVTFLPPEFLGLKITAECSATPISGNL